MDYKLIILIILAGYNSFSSASELDTPTCDYTVNMEWLDKKSQFGYAKIPSDIAIKAEIPEWIFIGRNRLSWNVYDISKLIPTNDEKKLKEILHSAQYSVDISYKFLKVKSKTTSGEIWGPINRMSKKNIFGLCAYMPDINKTWIFQSGEILNPYIFKYGKKCTIKRSPPYYLLTDKDKNIYLSMGLKFCNITELNKNASNK